MGGRRRLRAGAPRLLGRHDGARGRAYRRAYSALEAEFDLTSPLAKLEAGRVSLNWCHLQTATESLEAARRAREEGRGRRPSPRTIERLARRQGLANADFSQALAALRELVGTQCPPASIADLVTRRQGERPA
jgi:hypothetical protein